MAEKLHPVDAFEVDTFHRSIRWRVHKFLGRGRWERRDVSKDEALKLRAEGWMAYGVTEAGRSVFITDRLLKLAEAGT